MIQLSHSKLNIYRTCPYKYYLLEELKREKLKPRVTPDCRKYLEGWAAHKCLELWCKEGYWIKGWMQENLNISDIVNQYLKENYVMWLYIDDQKDLEQHLKNNLYKIEEGIIYLGLDNPDVVSEYKFKIEIPDTYIILTGIIDLIDNRYFNIYDMKYSEYDIINWNQLLLYDLAYTNLLGKKVNQVGVFTPLHEGFVETKENTQEDLDNFVEELKTIENEINLGNFPMRGAVKGKCYGCEVYAECVESK